MAQSERQQQDAQQAAQRQQQQFAQSIAAQQSQFQQQLAAQQKQAQEAQKQLMIQLNKPDRAPAEIRMTGTSDKNKQQLRKRGTTGYFGRKGLRIQSLNVPQQTAGIMSAMSPVNSTNINGGSFL